MSIKVKGEAIKEGSIPLSALSNEVKDKIENAGGGADWNAQEGEAGYIENRPFSRKHISKVLNDYIYDVDYGHVIHAAADGLESINVIDENIVFTSIGNYELTHPFYVPKILGDYTVRNKYGQQFTLGVVDYDNLLYVEIYGGDEDILHIEYDIVTFLSSAYIDDTVLKTTPQTLSADAKNQALANLDIDPVVWKYLCNPLILGDYLLEIPLELRDIILGDYSEEFGYTLKPIASSLIKIYNGAGFTSIATFGNGQDYNIDFENNNFIINNHYEIEFV